MHRDLNSEDEFLRNSERRFYALFKNVPVAIKGFDSNGIIIFWNKGCEKLYGYTEKEAIGQNLIDLIIPEEAKESTRLKIKKIKQTGQCPGTQECQRLQKKGSLVPVLLKHTIVKLENSLTEYYCLGLDMTLQHQYRKQLVQAYKMKAIAALSGGIAHHFNNALYAILGNLDLIEMDLQDNDNENEADYLREIRNSAYRIKGLTSQLLAYAGGGKYHSKLVLFNDFIKNTISFFKETLCPGIYIYTNFIKENLSIEADLTQMQTVLFAVLTNACEAMEDGGHIWVRCKREVVTEKKLVCFPGLKPGNYACLKIIDDGIGMDADIKDRVFEPFFSTKFAGRGLGMAGAYGIVKNHGGFIYIDSEPGKGTTVKIYLPLIKSVETHEKEEKNKLQSKLEADSKVLGTILVVDDNKTVLDVTSIMLERMGYNILKAATGKDAIRLTNEFKGKIDLVLLDILMLDMNGDEVYPHIRKARPDLKVLVYSGYSLNRHARKLLDVGAEGFIQKPFTMFELSKKIKEIIKT